jgi:hypothetical protein
MSHSISVLLVYGKANHFVWWAHSLQSQKPFSLILVAFCRFHWIFQPKQACYLQIKTVIVSNLSESVRNPEEHCKWVQSHCTGSILSLLMGTALLDMTWCKWVNSIPNGFPDFPTFFKCKVQMLILFCRFHWIFYPKQACHLQIKTVICSNLDDFYFFLKRIELYF